jgi:Tfp pilus assembly protein PilV
MKRTITKLKSNGLKQKGANLIEVVVTLGVISFGILSVLYLQGELSSQSANNKARAEAVALAQERIEEMRNLTNQVSDASQFDTPYLTGYAGTETGLQGVNANFNRTTSVTPTTSATQVTVTVSWTDRSNNARSVELSSDFAWASPRAPGDLAKEPNATSYTPPTGVAKLGEGRLPDDVNPQLLADQDDNLVFYMDGDDLKLADEAGNIVLTLEDGCKGESTVDDCSGFVTINGRVYIDTATQRTLKPGQIAVKSSDTTYCTRFYEADGSVVTLGNTDTNALSTTPDGDYKYFDYTCYASFGWHGNIGIILEGGNQLTDKVCQGDPIASAASGWEEPVIAARRIYRGMFYEPDASTDSGKVEDGNGVPLYWSVGVAAGAELGYEVKYDDGQEIKIPKHSFIVSSMESSATTGDNCITEGIMVRPDSDVDGDETAGDLFAGVPDDFYCLNPHVDQSSLDMPPYAIDPTCPFDPSGPPIAHYTITGGLSGSATLDTSDGPGNCTLSDEGYKCDVYDWGDGWNGFLQVNTDLSTHVCSHDRAFVNDVMENTDGSAVYCMAGASSVVRGSITLLKNAEFSEVMITQHREYQVLDGEGYPVTDENDDPVTDIMESSRPCEVDLLTGNFSCVTDDLSEYQDWAAYITVFTNGDYVCDTTDGEGNIEIEQFAAGNIYTQDVIVAERRQGCPR